MGLITPILLVALSVGAFMLYIQPTYSGTTAPADAPFSSKSIQQLLIDKKAHDEAEENATKLITERKKIEDVRSKISDDKVKQLDKMVPSNVDGVRLTFDLDSLARQKGMALSNVTVGLSKKGDTSNGQIDTDVQSEQLKKVDVSFNVKGGYEGLKDFLRAMENSLRIADIKSLSMGEPDEQGLYDLKVAMVIYWLK